MANRLSMARVKDLFDALATWDFTAKDHGSIEIDRRMEPRHIRLASVTSCRHPYLNFTSIRESNWTL
jgi:hypothetical protein